MESTKTVILHRQKDMGTIFIFQRNNCWATMEKRGIRPLLGDPSTWYLTDGLRPPPGKVEAVTVLVASPSKDYYKDFLACCHTAPLHYLPIWSLNELNIVAKWYKQSQEEVEERYLLVGGIARYVLEKRHVENESPKTLRQILFRR